MRNQIKKIRYALVSLIILAVFLVGTSCAYFSPVSPSISGQTPVSSPTDSPSVQQLVNETPAMRSEE
ncbi:MAG: hypothetical protein PHU08_03320, partial [Dehalococcoidales bacterium]|nr:hypothetical protein [Dehalococcoidales bacterium]